VIEFVAAGNPRAVSRAIEDCATEQRSVSAIVVPWESDAATLSMSVTAVSGDGWAIEHANLGTIRLTDLGNDRTQVTMTAEQTSDPDRQERAPLFERFAQQIQHRFALAS
jgi:hypothetical protein